MSQKRIAVIAGDGIGKEVVPEGVRVLDAAARKFGIDLHFDHFDFSSWDYYEKHGQMMPDNWRDLVGSHDAIYFGAVGWPAKIADHVSLWGSLLLFRREFDQYINLRPARLMPGIVAPVVRKDGSPRQPGEIDMYIVRENTEGEYSAVGGRMFGGTDREMVMQESIFTRYGVDRVLKFAYELAQSRPKKHLTAATKSNGIAITMPYWDERLAEMAQAYPSVKTDKFHIDILTAHFVQRPDFFDVVVASNLFGDILSDLGPACTGTIGIAPSVIASGLSIVAVGAWGLQMCAKDPKWYSNSVTAIVVPEGFDARDVMHYAYHRYNLSLGAGLSEVLGKVFRIGHLGDLNEPMILGTLAAIELALNDAGVPHNRGKDAEAIRPGEPIMLCWATAFITSSVEMP